MPSTPYHWELLVEHAASSPRDTSEGIVFRDKMWLSNAYHHGNVLVRDLWNSTDGVHWSQVSDDTPYDGYSEMVVYEDWLFAVKESVWVSDDGERWTKILDKTPFGMTGYGELIVYKGKMWQIGPGARGLVIHRRTTLGMRDRCHRLRRSSLERNGALR